MKHNSTATQEKSQALLTAAPGLVWGLLGVGAFSLTVPLTRIAVSGGGMDPLFVGSGRAVIAALLAAVSLWITGQKRPSMRQCIRLGVVAIGVVAGFPLLTSFAMTSVPASHGAVVIALLPAATAVASALRTKERPRTAFWLAAGLGALVAVLFAAINGGGVAGLHGADFLLFIAVVVCSMGYAEGGLLARELGAWQTISWALVLASPVMASLTALSLSHGVPSASFSGWVSFAYLGVVSMFLGFIAWYRGLGLGPMSLVSQVQLAQPVLTLGWASILLGEHLGWSTVVGGLAVIACALLAVRTRNVDSTVPEVLAVDR
ncbi:DMT family transporter [Glutamicibacter sp. JC586]|uniref:DMT family transporter n=1 Tax=Glutamicibacter sp. JC586 TaxID=2590552 RepID=UPI0013576768|nr:DMT family transporter [Glutamicibacter sp. JC586]